MSNMSLSLSMFVSSFTNEIITRMNSVNLLFNIDELIKYLETVEEAIDLARANIPSSRLITAEELQLARRFIADYHLGLDSTNDILDISTSYVMHNEQQIIYVLKIPKIKAVNYELYYIEPIVNNNSKIHVQTNYYLKGSKSYSVQSTCPKLKNLYICSSSQLKQADQCITKLINGNSADCPVEKTYIHNHIKRIDDVNIVINEANITLSSNCLKESRTLIGSFLIQFSNCSVYLNDEEYVNLDTIIPTKPFIPTTGLKVNVTKTLDRIPLEYLQTFHLEHRKTLQILNLTTQSIQGRLNISQWLSFGSISTTTIITIGIIAIWLLKGTFQRNNKAQREDDAHSEQKEEHNPIPGPRRPRLIQQQ